MSFCLRKELQNAGMKEAGLMGEMITCQWCKCRLSSERELEKDGFHFLLWDHLKLPGLSFLFSNEVLGEQSNGVTVSGAGSP